MITRQGRNSVPYFSRDEVTKVFEEPAEACG
jgi:hypothetical protein